MNKKLYGIFKYGRWEKLLVEHVLSYNLNPLEATFIDSRLN